MALRLTRSWWLLFIVFLNITVLLNNGVLGLPKWKTLGSSFGFGQNYNSFGLSRSHNPFGLQNYNSFGLGQNHNSFGLSRSHNPFGLQNYDSFNLGQNHLSRSSDPFGLSRSHNSLGLQNYNSFNLGQNYLSQNSPLSSFASLDSFSSNESPSIGKLSVSKENSYQHKPASNQNTASFSGSSSGKRPTGPTKFDLPFDEQKKLLGATVISQQKVERPIKGTWGLVNHAGVLIETSDGKKYLIHKGSNYGRAKGGDTVITDAKHMSSKWTKIGSVKHNTENVRVTDLIKKGGRDYKLLWDNCIHAANRIMKGKRSD